MYPIVASEAAELWNRRRAEMRDSRGGRGRKKRSYLVDASEMTREFRVEREGEQEQP